MAGHAKQANPKQLAFAHHVALGSPTGPLTPTDAARLAGYHKGRNIHKTVNRLMSDPRVTQEIDNLRTQARASLVMDAETWERELLHQYERVRDANDKNGLPVAADALNALDKWAKRLALYEQHESGERAAEVLTALAGIGQRMIANRKDESAPLTIEARVTDLIHKEHAPAHTRVLTVDAGQTDTEDGTEPVSQAGQRDEKGTEATRSDGAKASRARRKAKTGTPMPSGLSSGDEEVRG